MKELLKKLRKYEIKIRKAVNSHMQGEFKSVFKGTGLDFDDVRGYQYGDDIRTINWNVSAKGHGAYVNTYREEKDQSVFFLLDVSASQEIGKVNQKKIDISKEITGVLTLSAIRQGSQVGLLCFSNDKEKYIRPEKGNKHAAQLIGEMYKLRRKHKQTSIEQGIKQSLGIMKKRSVVILISDFLDENYETALKTLARKHDLIVIQVYDKVESKFPRLGIVPIKDKESGKVFWVNTSFSSFRKKTSKLLQANIDRLVGICKKHEIDYLTVSTNEDYVPRLIELFRKRNKTWKRAS